MAEAQFVGHAQHGFHGHGPLPSRGSHLSHNQTQIPSQPQSFQQPIVSQSPPNNVPNLGHNPATRTNPTTNNLVGVPSQSSQQQMKPERKEDMNKPNTTSVGAVPSNGGPSGPSVPPVPGVGAATASASAQSASSSQSEEGSRAVRSKYRTYILADAVFEVERRYEIKEIVGHGAYGVVCSARDLKTGAMVAVKKIENVFEHRSLAKRTLRELKLLRYFYHENILGLERVMRPYSSTFNNVYMVSELMETDLACVIRSPQPLTDEHCQFFIYQVLRGLKYIHSANVVHRDLKPRNLLVNSNCDLKICDFGLARLDDPENADRCVMSNYVATRWYRAPEVILSRARYTKAVDMWAVGCILAELIGRRPLFPGRDSFHQVALIVNILGTPPVSNVQSKKSRDYVQSLPKKPKIPFTQIFPNSNPLACELLDHLLQFDPEQRYTVEQALRHPYLEDLHCEEDEPVCESFDPQDFYFEYLRTTKEDLRVLIHQEVANNYKEDDYVPPEQAGGDRSALDNLTQMLKTLPRNKRKGRRKSF